jgi:hypothetical protein
MNQELCVIFDHQFDRDIQKYLYIEYIMNAKQRIFEFQKIRKESFTMVLLK